ncbi:MAG TPA: hypothetical protein VEY71_10390, partial [Chitinophagales bacterium]|nr:hypothetical protein [Chitinophagales bacterium]
MVVVGAGGHAIEILQLLLKDFAAEDIALFDDTGHIPSLAALYPVINSLEKLATHFATQSEFVLATGSPRSREALAGKCTGAGGKLTSVIASTAIIGNYNVSLGNGINVMHRVLITGDVWIGEGVLI